MYKNTKLSKDVGIHFMRALILKHLHYFVGPISVFALNSPLGSDFSLLLQYQGFGDKQFLKPKRVEGKHIGN